MVHKSTYRMKITAVLLALLCAFGWGDVPGLVVLPVRAAEPLSMTAAQAGDAGFIWSGTGTSELTITGFTAPNGFTGALEIPAVIDSEPVTSIGNWAFDDCTALTSVTIPNSVTNIGTSAFSITSLTTVIIPSSVTSIGNYAFDGCDELTTVTILGSTTTIGDDAFLDCTALTTVNAPAGSAADTFFSDMGKAVTSNSAVITYEGVNGCDNSNNPTTYNYGTGVTQFAALTGRTGYTFDSWSPSSIGQTEIGAKTITAIWKNNTPSATPAYDYVTEEMKGLASGGEYQIGSTTGHTATAGGNLSIADYIGQEITLTHLGNGTTILDSDPVNITIPSRNSAPPNLTAVPESSFGGNNGKITGLDPAVPYDYKPAGGNYTTVSLTNEIPGLAPGTYFVRYTANTLRFATQAAEFTIAPYVRSNDATLSALTVSPGTLSPTFNPAVELYTATLPYGTQSLTVTATANDPGATVYNSKVYDLSIGDNPMDNPVGVLAEDGETRKFYTIEITIESSASVTLVLQSGTVATPLTSYPYGQTTQLPIPTRSGYTFGGWYITTTFEGSPITQLLPTDRGAKTLYARWIPTLPTPAAEIVYEEETIAFENAIENIDAAFAINGDAYRTDDNAKIPIEEDWFGEDITIIAKGDGISTADSAAQSLSIPARPAAPSLTTVDESSYQGGNGKITGLSAGVIYEYKPTGGTYTTITGQTEIANLAPGVYTVRVKAGSTNFTGQDSAALTIAAYVRGSDAALSSLAVSAGTLSPAFAPGVTGYAVALPYGASGITVTAAARDPDAAVSGEGAIPLQTGENSIPILVTAEDGITTQTYTITVTVASPPPVIPEEPPVIPEEPPVIPEEPPITPEEPPVIPEEPPVIPAETPITYEDSPVVPDVPASPITIKTGFQNGRAYRDTRVNGKLEVRAYTADSRVSGRTTGGMVRQIHNLFTQFFQNPLAVVSLLPRQPLGVETEFAVRVDLTGLDPQDLWFYAYDAASNTYKRLPAVDYFLDRNGFLHFTAPIGGDVIISGGKLASK